MLRKVQKRSSARRQKHFRRTRDASPTGCYVTYVSVDAIHIARLDGPWTRRLRAAGLDVRRGWFSSDGTLAVHPAGPDGCASVDQEDKLMALARLGVAFAADYKQGMDPAGIMLDLCARGRYLDRFLEYSFDGRRSHIRALPVDDQAD